MHEEYVKDYKEKELKQFVTVYFLIAVASVGFCELPNFATNEIVSVFSKILTIDILVGAISLLVFLLNELWPDKVKNKLVYNTLPSDSIFSDIAEGNVDSNGFDLASAQKEFSSFAKAIPSKQTAKWNSLLSQNRKEENGNVIEALRMQLLTRDLCMSTISLFIVNLLAFFLSAIVFWDWSSALQMFAIPAIYLIVMFFITKIAAKTRAKRLVLLVIKNAMQQGA